MKFQFERNYFRIILPLDITDSNRKSPESEGDFGNFPSPRLQAEGEGNFQYPSEDEAGFPINPQVASTNIRDRAIEILLSKLLSQECN